MGPDLKPQAHGRRERPPAPAFALASAAAAAPGLSSPPPVTTRCRASPRPTTSCARRPPRHLSGSRRRRCRRRPKRSGPGRPAAPQPITTGATVERAPDRPGSGPATSRGRAKPRQASRDARGGFEIQIGAFSDSAEAERNMASARQRAGGVLDSYSAVAVPAQKGASQSYRARFNGFDASRGRICLRA